MGHKPQRGKGEGSVFRRADGYWVGAVEVGRDAGGRRRKARVVRKRKADVLDALDELRRQVRQGVVPDQTRSLAAYLDWWLVDVIAGTVTAGSLHEYGTRVKRITPVIGHVKLGRLTTAHVQRLANQLAQTYPRSPKTRATTLATLRQALRWAVGADLISRNPAEHVSGPKLPVSKLDDTLTADEAKRVLQAAADDAELGAFWWLAVSYGLRIGELMALRWTDVDDDELTVRRAKTPSGVRTLPLIPEARRVLWDHRRRAGGPAPITGLVFHRPDGRPLYYQLVHDRWNDLLRDAGVAHVCRNCESDETCSTSVRRFHTSRHTAATTLLERGVPLEVVSAVLGHANLSVTADVYARVTQDAKRRALARLDGK